MLTLEQTYQIKEYRKEMDEINQDIERLINSEGKTDWNKVKELRKEYYKRIALIEDIKGLIYNNEQWVTSICSEPCNTQQEARDNVLAKLLALNGVSLFDVDDGKKTKKIMVITKNVAYLYEIHAHIVDGKYVACCGKNICKDYRKEYYYDCI